MSERSSAVARDSEKYPEGVVEAALQDAKKPSEPGLFDTLRGLQSTYDRVSQATDGLSTPGASDVLENAFSAYMYESDYEQDLESLSALSEVSSNITDPKYVFKGRTRSRLRSGPYEVFSDSDKSLVSE